jgi:hypothetical protein
VATTPRNNLTGAEVADAAELAGVAAPATVDAAVRGARDWLDQVFTPFYETRAATFDDACEHARVALDRVWTDVRGALREVSELRSLGDRPVRSPFTTMAAAATAPPPAQPPRTASANQTPPTEPTVVPPVPSATPPPVRDDRAGHASGSIADRLDPGGAVAQNTHGDQKHDGSQTPGQTDTAAVGQPTAVGGGATGPAAPRATPEAGDDEHSRRVTLQRDPIAAESPMATPTGVVGGEDDPAAYNEAREFGDDEPRPVAEQPAPVAEEPPHGPFVWQLTEDGEIEQVSNYQ